MKLTDIDLNDHEEIAAAAALLQSILDAAPEENKIRVSDIVKINFGPVSSPTVQLNSPAEVKQFFAQPAQDPAAAFAASPLAAAGAPSTAGAGRPAIAPVALPGTLPAMTGQLMPAAAAPGLGAPMASAAETAPVSNVPLDKNGLPWDERIHAATKTRNADNSWKAKRGVDKDLVPQVEAELRARLGNGNIAAPVAAPASLPAITGNVSLGAVAPLAGSIDPAAAFAAAPVGGPVQSPDPQTFELLMPRVTMAVTSGQLPPQAITQACAANGIASVVTLQQNPQFVPLVWATLKQAYPALQ